MGRRCRNFLSKEKGFLFAKRNASWLPICRPCDGCIHRWYIFVEVIINTSEEVASLRVAEIIADLLRKKPQAVLGLATGSTPLALYRRLVRVHREEALDFSQVRTFNLDEYYGLGPDHDCSFRRFMDENFFELVNISRENTHMPDGLAKDVAAHCLRYEDAIAATGGIDIQILGIGSDGHIGFNEPSSSLSSRTRLKTLTSRTRMDNAVFFPDLKSVPHHAITMGVGTILEAKCILVLAFGAKKARAVAAMVEGALSAKVPASALQMHPHVTVMLDEAAASLLELSDYYRHAFSCKRIEGQPDYCRAWM